MGSLFSSCPVAHEQLSSIDSLTDEAIYELIQKTDNDNAFRPSGEEDSFIANTVWRITSDAVAKRTSRPTEVFMISYVSLHTSIPIPKVRRVLSEDPSDPKCDTWWIVMDHVDGEVLHDAWPSMTIWRKLWVMWTTRRYIRELQKTPVRNPDVPGPFDDSGKSYLCRGSYFTEYGAGPFNSYGEMAAWFDRRRFDALAFIHKRTGVITHCPKFDTSHPLVLCHMDLHMRNFIIDKSGKLWLIDWANAGAFPPWLEYAQMVVWGSETVREAAKAPKLWTWCTRFMVGDYRHYLTGYLEKIRWVFERSTHFGEFVKSDYFDELGLNID
ncbi:hypothetical protein M413DRAFT_449371 [Hebeloma cylindrosporum]|uniref:Aminoglycoside phosphotransferase domain-containing protein n=1 Tax=Hebeloma cylindrosporum TaxID=76867 RepID=A0A0C3BXN2_HEBCY|nr:hypothetical protein M413DRAFT_449371 [Hebeloma cylindrosporum h7]